MQVILNAMLWYWLQEGLNLGWVALLPSPTAAVLVS